MPRLGLTGDVMLGRTVDERQRRRDAAAVWGDLLDRLRSLDGLLINLECCLSTRGEPWTRTYRPFHFRADPDWVPALEAPSTTCAAGLEPLKRLRPTTARPYRTGFRPSRPSSRPI